MSHPEALTPRDAGIETRPRSALETTMADLGRSLRSIGLNPSLAERADAAAREIVAGRRGTFPDDVYKRVEESVAKATAALDEANVQMMLREPYRITLAVYGPRAAPIWPFHDLTAAEVLDDCREVRGTLHWSQPDSRRHALRQAERALELLVAMEGRADG